MKNRLATIGDNCIDVYLPPHHVTAVGGQAVNVAVTWARLGCQVDYFGAIGRDANGERIRAALTAEGVAARLKQSDVRSAVSLLRVLPDGDRLVVCDDPGACARYEPSDQDLDSLSAATFVHCANFSGFRRVARALRKKGVPMSYDFSTDYDVDEIGDLDTAFFSWPGQREDGDLRALAEKAMANGVRCVVATCGAGGSIVFEASRATVADATQVKPVDTCGAGDTYAAVFTLARLRGTAIAPAMKAASEAALITCGHLGAWAQELLTTVDIPESSPCASVNRVETAGRA